MNFLPSEAKRGERGGGKKLGIKRNVGMYIHIRRNRVTGSKERGRREEPAQARKLQDP